MGQDFIGQVLQDTYRVERMIGEGGMGAVYEASHQRLPHQRFAIKVLFPSVANQPDALARFRREAEITSAIGHPHILMVLDFNVAPDGAAYIVMELLKGEDLAARIQRRGRLDLREAASIFRQAASALEAAHKKGVVHRDLKPKNVFLCRRGKSYNFVKIVDFGISKVLGSQSLVTRTNALMGTPCYMSPEQAEERAAQLDAQADVYAMGVILFEMLTGRPPFVAQTVPSLLYKIVHERPPTVRGLRPEIPAAVDAAVTKALSKHPEQRHRSIAAFWHELAQAVGIEGADFYEPTEDRSEEWAVGNVPTNATLPLPDDPEHPTAAAAVWGNPADALTAAPDSLTAAPGALAAGPGAMGVAGTGPGTLSSTLSNSSGESRRRTMILHGPSRLVTIGVAFAFTLIGGVLVVVLSTRSSTPTPRAVPAVEVNPTPVSGAARLPAAGKASPAPKLGGSPAPDAAAAASRPALDGRSRAAKRSKPTKPETASTAAGPGKPTRKRAAKATKPTRKATRKPATPRSDTAKTRTKPPTKKKAPTRIGEGIMDF